MTPDDLQATRLGLSAEAFARAIGIADGRSIRRYEAGREPPGSVRVIVEMAAEIPAVKAHLIKRAQNRKD